MKQKTPKPQTRVLATNRLARYKYKLDGGSILCGVAIPGHLVKAVKDSKATIRDAYCVVQDGALVAHNFVVEGHSFTLKLLVSSKELVQMSEHLEEKGTAIVPIELISTKGWVKLRVSFASGKKKHDKRQAEKEKDAKKRVREATI